MEYERVNKLADRFAKKCETPEAVFSIKIKPTKVGCEVKLPFKLDLSKEEAEKLEDKIHDAFENVLKDYF
jgi:hypothetical protein